jgi:hypothetical protein
MSDRFTRPTPSMTAEQASRLARRYEALAEEMEDAEQFEDAALMARRAKWWLAYSTNLTKLP